MTSAELKQIVMDLERVANALISTRTAVQGLIDQLLLMPVPAKIRTAAIKKLGGIANELTQVAADCTIGIEEMLQRGKI